MASKTGRPPGRPVLYSEEERPVSMSVRIPRNLFNRVKSYAGRHRQSISELILDGLQMRLEQDEPQTQIAYYDNTVLQELAQPAHLLDDRIPFDEDLHTGAPEADLTIPAQPNSCNTVLQDTATTVPPFDEGKYVLGKLCRHGHAYHSTGQSLRRRSDNECLACHNARMAAHRDRKRQTQPA